MTPHHSTAPAASDIASDTASDTASATAPIRLLFLDGLRALAALWVVLGHAHLLTLGWTRSGTLWGRPFDLLLYCHLGVDVFLVLSGFCLALPVVRNGGRLTTSTAVFLGKRAWRILVPYYATLLLILLINTFVPIAQWGNHGVGLTPTLPWEVVVTNALLLQDVLPQFNTLHGPFWSVSTEWHLYFIFPALVWILRRFGVLALALVGGAAAIVLTSLPSQPGVAAALAPMTVPQPPYFIALFVMGAVAAALVFDPRYARLRAAAQRWAWAVAALFCVPLCALLWHFRIVNASNIWGFFDHLHWIDPLAGAVTAALLVGLTGLAPRQGMRRLLEWRPLVAVGGFSYSLYLIHVPVLAVVNQIGARQGMQGMTGFYFLALVGTAASLVAAWYFARVFERPYRRARGKNVVVNSAAAPSPAQAQPVLREPG